MGCLLSALKTSKDICRADELNNSVLKEPLRPLFPSNMMATPEGTRHVVRFVTVYRNVAGSSIFIRVESDPQQYTPYQLQCASGVYRASLPSDGQPSLLRQFGPLSGHRSSNKACCWQY